MYNRGPGLGFNPQPDPPKGSRAHHVAYQPSSASRIGGGSVVVPLYSNPGQALTPFGADPKFPEPAGGWALWGVISTASMAASAYHGYKRNNSVGWAIGWALLGGMFPVITIPVSLAQGFGKRKGR